MTLIARKLAPVLPDLAVCCPAPSSPGAGGGWWPAVLLGVIQGLTEFLPISSSAHLVVLPGWLGSDYLGKGFDVALHLGTLGAVLVYLRADLARLGRAACRGRAGDRERRRLGSLALASLPAAGAGPLLAPVVEAWLHGPVMIAWMLILFALPMAWADRRGGRREEVPGPRESLLIGLAQALALVPGVSRSGATLTACRALGLSREEAARHALLLSVPVILGAGLWQLRPPLFEQIPWPEAILGAGAAFLTGLVSVRLLVGLLRRGSVLPFVVYRLVFGLCLLAREWGR